MNSRPRIFLSYARENQEEVKKIAQMLFDKGFDPFWDREKLYIGDTWREKIREAISNSQLFIACLSTISVRKKGFFQAEINQALEISDEMPPGSAFILPLLLDECADTMHRRLRDEYQYVRFFEDSGPDRLVEGIRKQLESKKEPERALEEKEISPPQEILDGLNKLFGVDENPPKYLEDLIKNMGTLVEAVSDLQRNPDWANDRYINFISGLLNSVIDVNIVRFKNLRLGGDRPLLFPRVAAEMADDILAEQMKAMEKGDHYDVISDVVSWRDGQLEKFQEQTKKAVERGVVVLRVFNLLRPFHESLEPEEVKEILKIHLQDSKEWQSTEKGKYEIKVLADDELKKHKRALAPLGRVKIADSHFGVFRHGSEGKAVRFKVPPPGLSEMLICRDQEIIRQDLALFNKVWVAASWFDEDRIQCIV